MRQVQVQPSGGASVVPVRLPSGVVNLMPGASVLVDEPPRSQTVGGFNYLVVQLLDGRSGFVNPWDVLTEAEITQMKPVAQAYTKPRPVVRLPGAVIEGYAPIPLWAAVLIGLAGAGTAFAFGIAGTRRTLAR